MVEIIIENLQDTINISDALLDITKKALETGISIEKFNVPSLISVYLVDNEYIKTINAEQRGIDKPTDVLSFPMVHMVEGQIIDSSGDFDMESGHLILGDIMISTEKIYEQAENYGHTMERELAFLVTHGLFHLLGYDHQDKESETIMLQKQESVLEQMRLKRNEK